MAPPLKIGRIHDHDGNETRNWLFWLLTTANTITRLIKTGHVGFDTQRDVLVVKTSTELRDVVFREKQKEVGTNYTLLPSDDRQTIFLTTGITITIDNTLPDGFSCDFYSVTGPTTFTSGTATVSYPDGSILGSGKVATLFKRDSNSSYILKGELTNI